MQPARLMSIESCFKFCCMWMEEGRRFSVEGDFGKVGYCAELAGMCARHGMQIAREDGLIWEGD